MKIAVYGGTGRVGSAVVAEAASRGHDVVALSRNESRNELPAGAVWQQGDAADPGSVAKLATDVDAIVTALGPSRVPGEDPFAFAGVVRRLAEAVGTTRVLVVGGAGSLYVAPGVRLVDTPQFPAEYRDESLASAEALEYLRGTGESVDWTFLCPPPVIDEGERTGSYRRGDENPVGTFISFADFAIAVVDELERPAHRHARFTVATT
jgi:putative NADH-flavin reductase